MQSVAKRLEVYKFSKVILWWERLNSGKVRTEYGSWVQMCQKGTPDFIAVIYDKNKNIKVLFFECKRSDGKGTIRLEQKIFMQEMEKYKDIHCHIIENPKEVDAIINKLGYDSTVELPENIG